MKTLNLEQILKIQLSATAIFALLALFSVICVDRNLTIMIHNYGMDAWMLRHGLRHITEGLPLALPFAYLVLISFKKPTIDVGYRMVYIIYLYSLTKFTILCKQELKILFGRYWPSTWSHNNLSLIHDGVYGFDWFHGTNSSFPSGHSTFVAIICLSLALIYPRLRYWCYALIAVMVISLVTLNYHFLGDCFAGIALANLFAILGLILYRYGYFKIRKLFIRLA